MSAPLSEAFYDDSSAAATRARLLLLEDLDKPTGDDRGGRRTFNGTD